MTTIPYAFASGVASRELDVSQWFNVRDLGGLPTAEGRQLRRGRLFRADAPVLLSQADLDVLRGMAVRNAVDLRTPAEAEEAPTAWEVVGVHRYSCPLVDVLPPPTDWHRYASVGYTTQAYRDMLEQSRPSQALLWSCLAEATADVTVLHCASGRDRTGVVVALLLSLLGVPRDLVVDDYARSSSGMQRMLAWLEEHRPDIAPQTSGRRRAFAYTPAETMQRFLDALDEQHGGPAGYIASLGLGDAVQTVKDRLLEPRPATDPPD